MIVTKFNSASPSGYTFAGDFTAGVPAWWVTIKNTAGGTDDFRLFTGDYIVQDDNGMPILYYPAAQYASDMVASNLIREYVGKELLRNIWATLRAALIPDAQKAGIINTTGIDPSLGMIRDGEITSARLLTNSIATNANFTAGVKTQLLALMDTAIAKL